MTVYVSKTLLPLKLHYFLFFGGLACIMQYLPVYAVQRGLSYDALTLVYTVLPFTVVLAKPLFGTLADRLQKHKLVFLFSIVFTAVSYFVIMFVPHLKTAEELTLECSVQDNLLIACGKPIDNCITIGESGSERTCNVSCLNRALKSVSCDDLLLGVECLPDFKNGSFQKNDVIMPQIVFKSNESYCVSLKSLESTICLNNATACKLSNCSCHNGTEVSNGDVDIYKSVEFVILFVLLIVSLDSAGIAISLGDTVVSNMVNEVNAEFGHQRVFGTIGWGLMSIIAGQIYKAVSKDPSVTDYTIGFYILLAMLLLDCLICTQIKVAPQPKPENFLVNVLKLYTNAEICVFSMAVFMMGAMTGALWTFLFVYVEEMENDPLLLGLIPGIQCFGGELIFFLISGWILKKIGHMSSMAVCLGCYGVRFTYYSLIWNPWWILPMEVSNGVTFGLFFTTMVSYASMNAPSGMTATMQSWLQCIFEGIGYGCGVLVSGMLYSYFGGRRMFLYLGIVSFVVCAMFTIATIILKRLPRKTYSPTENTELATKDFSSIEFRS